jgi:hypothetical protein
VLLARNRQYREALDACDELLALSSLRGEGYLIAAHCHTKLGQPAKAAEALKGAERVMTPQLELVREQLRRLLD